MREKRSTGVPFGDINSARRRKQIECDTSVNFVSIRFREQTSNLLNPLHRDMKYNRPFVSKSTALKIIWFL